MTDSPADPVITGRTVLVHDDQERVGFEEDAAVVVRDGGVESLTAASGVEHLAAAERVDGRGQVAMPGLINFPHACADGRAARCRRGPAHRGVVQRRRLAVESNLTERDVELGARLACAEMIRGGVTCFADHYFAMDAVAAVVDECGLRAHPEEPYFSSQRPQSREKPR